MQILQEAALTSSTSSSHRAAFLYTYDEISKALVTSFKRLLGLNSVSAELQSSLSLDILKHDGPQSTPDMDQEITLQVRPLGYDQTVSVTPSQATTILLLAIRLSSQAYVKANQRKKNLNIPGGSPYDVVNAVIGVPAHYSQSQRQLVIHAARQAGFTGQVSVLVESTAAAMAYGIFVSRTDEEKTILVFDSGGGTTDVTIATMRGDATSEESQRFQVVVTEGDARLGGDDMDAALLTKALNKLGQTKADVKDQHRQLLDQCRRAKERLCGDVDHGYQKPEDSVSISVGKAHVDITPEDLDEALRPWIESAVRLVNGALRRYASEKDLSLDKVVMNEVILVGGATRVPAVRQMLREIFPPPMPPDLCLSVNAMAAVAQGAAIQASIQSGRVPHHEVRSAMMLDSVPHAIGVLLPDPYQTFVEIIPRDAPLPASGSAIFYLANVEQPGVSFTAVEQVRESGDSYPVLGEFTFLLARLSKDQASVLQGRRPIEIRMTLEESGKFLVSYYDENDPEHAGLESSAKVSKGSKDVPVLAFHEDNESLSWEQIMLIISCAVLFLAYVAARIYFQEELALKSG